MSDTDTAPKPDKSVEPDKPDEPAPAEPRVEPPATTEVPEPPAPPEPAPELPPSTETPPPAPAPEPSEPPKSDPQPVPAPELSTPQVPGVPAAVLALTDAELRAAVAYFLQKHQRNLSSRGVAARQAKEKRNMDAAEKFIVKHRTVTLASVAYEINCSPGTTAKYLQRLVKQGRITADGWQKSRRYHAK